MTHSLEDIAPQLSFLSTMIKNHHCAHRTAPLLWPGCWIEIYTSMYKWFSYFPDVGLPITLSYHLVYFQFTDHAVVFSELRICSSLSFLHRISLVRLFSSRKTALYHFNHRNLEWGMIRFMESWFIIGMSWIMCCVFEMNQFAKWMVVHVTCLLKCQYGFGLIIFVFLSWA